MKDTILIIKPDTENQDYLEPLWLALSKKHFEISKLSISRNKYLPSLDSKFIILRILFTAYLPIAALLFYKLAKKNKPKIIITTTITEMLLSSILQPILKHRTFYLALPEKVDTTLGRKKLFDLCKACEIVTFSSQAKTKLDQSGFKNKKSIILPSIEPKSFEHQDTIFNSLAKVDHPKRKFFTLGTIIDINSESHLESLLGACKEIMELIPNLQLIIVGDGPEKKNFQWMAKQLGIESVAWFVGQSDKPSKWLENLDLYVVTRSRLSLKDQHFVLEIMQRGLPVVADICSDLDDLIHDGKTGQLVNFRQAKDIAEAIIKLEQDPRNLEKMREASKERVGKLFSVDKQLDQFAKLL